MFKEGKSEYGRRTQPSLPLNERTVVWRRYPTFFQLRQVSIVVVD
jgi:hypothetical protein